MRSIRELYIIGHGPCSSLTMGVAFACEYVKEKYPKYSDYTDLLALLGQDFSVKEASDILQKPQKTLYGWIKKLRTIFDEYIQTTP